VVRPVPRARTGPEGEVAERAGQVELVKVDVDANQGLAAQFGVSGIPAVKAFRNGTVVKQLSAPSHARRCRRSSTTCSHRPAPRRSSTSFAPTASFEVVAALDADDVEGALSLIVDAVPLRSRPSVSACARLRLRLRPVGAGRPDRVRYRRRLATALY
jgi:thioredoxin-like negative regulator of GroEL